MFINYYYPLILYEIMIIENKFYESIASFVILIRVRATLGYNFGNYLIVDKPKHAGRN